MTYEELWQRVCRLVEQATNTTIDDLPMPRIRQFTPEVASMFCDRVPYYHQGDNMIVYVDEPDMRQMAHEMAHAVIYLANIKLQDYQIELIPQMIDEQV